MATEASLVAEITTTDTTRTTTRHGKTFLIPNVSDNSVRPIPTAAVDSRSVTVVPMCAIIVGMGIHVARHVTAVNVIRTVTKMPAGSVSHEPDYMISMRYKRVHLVLYSLQFANTIHFMQRAAYVKPSQLVLN